MKKTLIALAVLAASGASFAQVAITGSYAAGYRASSDNGKDASGLGIDTSLVTFTASEDLGGGLKATAEMKIDGLNRGGVSGGDSFVSLGGNFGTVKLSTARGSDYLSGGISGVGGVGFDGKVFSALTASDSLGYTSPSFGGLTFGVSHSESAPKQTDETGTAVIGLGLGAGAAGSQPRDTYQRSTGVTATYAAGPLAASLNFTVWDQQGAATTGDAAGNGKSRTSIQGAYDFGVAKIGAGFRATQFVVGTRNDAFAAVGIPLGALTLGADWGSRTQNDTAVNDKAEVTAGTRTGYGLSASYALSKRTSVSLSTARWDAKIGNTSANTETNLLLAHSF